MDYLAGQRHGLGLSANGRHGDSMAAVLAPTVYATEERSRRLLIGHLV